MTVVHQSYAAVRLSDHFLLSQKCTQSQLQPLRVWLQYCDRLKSLPPRMFAAAVHYRAAHMRYFLSPPLPAKWCLLPGAVVLFLFFFLLFFFTDSEASASSLSPLKSSPFRSWGSTSPCSSAMISDWDIKWRISCWVPPVVRAERVLEAAQPIMSH